MARLMSIEASELEGVFKLGGSSIEYLVRAGFFVGAIEKIDSSSPIQKIRVLEDYQEVCMLGIGSSVSMTFSETSA
jgi:hypothetical protein